VIAARMKARRISRPARFVDSSARARLAVKAPGRRSRALPPERCMRQISPRHLLALGALEHSLACLGRSRSVIRHGLSNCHAARSNSLLTPFKINRCAVPNRHEMALHRASFSVRTQPARRGAFCGCGSICRGNGSPASTALRSSSRSRRVISRRERHSNCRGRRTRPILSPRFASSLFGRIIATSMQSSLPTARE
jgi:hypothetical protein